MSHALLILISSTKVHDMKGGTLEVLLVNAEGLRHTNLVGRPAYYVLIECGASIYRSKTSSGKDEKAWWNQKFRFEFPLSVWKNLAHLKFRIMDTELFSDGGFVGDAIVYLGGIVKEGYERGSIEVKPASYNVVVEDDTYKGQIKIGLKFTASVSVEKDMHIIETREDNNTEENKPRQSMSNSFVNLWRILRWRFLLLYKRTDTKNN